MFRVKCFKHRRNFLRYHDGGAVFIIVPVILRGIIVLLAYVLAGNRYDTYDEEARQQGRVYGNQTHKIAPSFAFNGFRQLFRTSAIFRITYMLTQRISNKTYFARGVFLGVFLVLQMQYIFM